MRAILILWAIPLILFWGWYGLSAYDLSFGLYFLERDFHDLIFRIYENMTGVPAEDIPGWLAGIFFVDTLIILAVAALRWYKHWLPQTISWIRQKTGFGQNEADYPEGTYVPMATGNGEAFASGLIGPVRPAE
ncbi:MAG: DUF6105 family protein [Pseudomonadota bacterium]